MWEREVPPAPFVPGEETKGGVAEAGRKWARYHRKADPMSAGVGGGVIEAGWRQPLRVLGCEAEGGCKP